MGRVLRVAGTALRSRTMLRFYRHVWQCKGLGMEGMRIREAARLGVAAALLAGCAPRVEIDEVPILGAGPRVEQRIRDAIAIFERDTGGGRVRLTEIRFKDIPVGGRLDRAKDRITLDPELVRSPALEAVVTHELCHALDYAEDLVDPEPWDTLAETMFDPALGLLDPDASKVGRVGKRREAYAAWCELGAFEAAMLERPCGEPDVVTAAMEWLAAAVWTEAEPLPSVEPDPGPGWSLEVPLPIDALDVRATADPDVALVGTLHEGPVLRLAPVDLRTGEIVESPGVGHDGSTKVPEGLPIGLRAVLAGWVRGPAAARAVVDWHYPGEPAQRLLWSDGQGWAVVGDGCLEVDEPEIFTGSGDVWLGWVEGRTVRMRPVAAPGQGSSGR